MSLSLLRGKWKCLRVCDVGSVNLTIIPIYNQTSIYVDASARGKGIASQLLHHLIVNTKAKGYRALVAGIDASNKRVLGPEKFLFTPTAAH